MNSSFGELSSWRVCLKSNKDEKQKFFELSNGINAACFTRNADRKSDQQSYLIRKNHIVGNQRDEFVDIEKEVLDFALIESQSEDPKWTKSYPKADIVRKTARRFRSP
jgi:hypothetical protein